MSKEVSWNYYRRGEGAIICQCDYCGAEHEHEFDGGSPNFKACQEELRTEGWASRRIDGEWYDFCSIKCLAIFIKERSKEHEKQSS